MNLLFILLMAIKAVIRWWLWKWWWRWLETLPLLQDVVTMPTVQICSAVSSRYKISQLPWSVFSCLGSLPHGCAVPSATAPVLPTAVLEPHALWSASNGVADITANSCCNAQHSSCTQLYLRPSQEKRPLKVHLESCLVLSGARWAGCPELGAIDCYCGKEKKKKKNIGLIARDLGSSSCSMVKCSHTIYMCVCVSTLYIHIYICMCVYIYTHIIYIIYVYIHTNI